MSTTTHPSSRRVPRTARTAIALVALCAGLTGSAAAADGGDSGASTAMPQSWVYAHTCGHLGVPCDDGVRSALRVRVHPARVAAGRTTRFRLRVLDRSSRSGVANAAVTFAGRRYVTDRRGRLVVVTRLLGGGRRSVLARTSSDGRARAWVRVTG